MANYRVGKMPGSVNDISLADNPGGQDHTLAEVLGAAGMEYAGFDIRVNGSPVDDLSANIAPDSSILLFKKVKGN